MEQDQEDFERDQRASNNIAENLDFFSNDDDFGLPNLVHDPVPTSSTPLPESANLNLELADLLSFLDEFKDIDFSFGPSELPAPTQTTSSIPVLQSGNPPEDEPFSLLNLNADASYTDHHAPESLAPIATANSVPVAQSTGFAGHYMSPFNYMDAPYANIDPQQLLAPTTATGLVQATQSAAFTENDRVSFEHMDLDAPYSNIDRSQFLAPTTTTGFEQAAQSADLMEDGTSRIIELDPDPVMALSGAAPTSSEQLPPPVSTDRVFPAEVAQSANSMTNFNGSDPPTASNLTSHPPLASPSNNMITTISAPGKQLQSELENSLPGRVYVPLRPKAAAISQSTELPSTSEPQDSSLLRFPSQGTLASRPASSVVKSKRKRLRSPQARPSDIPKDAPKDCFLVFPMVEQPEAAKDKDQQPPVAKRTRSTRTCLRCQILRKGCSGRFPCENCAVHFGKQAMERPGITIRWKYCVDSNILQLNFFTEFSTLLFLALDGPSAISLGQTFICPNIVGLPLQKRGRKAAAELMHIALSSTFESGISHLLGFQAARFVLATSPLHIPSIPPLLSIRLLLPRTPLRRHKMCSHYQGHDSSIAWLFAVTILQPDFLAELAGFSRQEIRQFTILVCGEFYFVTARLLAKARTEKMGSVNEDRATLIQHLEILYHLISNHRVQDRLTDQFAMVLTQTVKAIFLKQDPKSPNNSTIVRLLQAVCSRFLKSIRGEGWSHLQAFVRHRLRKLGGGCNNYSQVILRYLHLDTLCRINHKDETEDEGQIPRYFGPSFGQKFDRIILDNAYAMFHALHLPADPASVPSYALFEYLRRPGNKGPLHHAWIFKELSSLMKSRGPESHPEMSCHHESSLFGVTAAATMLDLFEMRITEMDARKGLNWPKDYRMIPPDNDQDDTLDPTHSGRNPVMTRLEYMERIYADVINAADSLVTDDGAPRATILYIDNTSQLVEM